MFFPVIPLTSFDSRFTVRSNKKFSLSLTDSLSLRLDVCIKVSNSELEFMVTNSAVWMSKELGNRIGYQYHAAFLPLLLTFPRFRAQSLGIARHSRSSAFFLVTPFLVSTFPHRSDQYPASLAVVAPRCRWPGEGPHRRWLRRTCAALPLPLAAPPLQWTRLAWSTTRTLAPLLPSTSPTVVKRAPPSPPSGVSRCKVAMPTRTGRSCKGAAGAVSNPQAAEVRWAAAHESERQALATRDEAWPSPSLTTMA